MKKPKKSRRGVSIVFMTIYLAMIFTLIGASLLTSAEISNTSLTQRVNLETEREHEKIQIQPGGVGVTDNLVDTVTVNNTGSITVRIRAIYINSILALDPSTNQSTYINAQENLEIQVRPYAEIPYASSDFITITTERGTIFRELMRNLEESGSIPVIDTVYGPIKLIFEEFHWAPMATGATFDQTTLNSAVFQEGWKVLPNLYGIWRIKIQNVGDQNIRLTGNCSLSLVSNQGGVQYAYFMDTMFSDTLLTPEDQPSPIYFTWKNSTQVSRRFENSGKLTPTLGQAPSWMVFLVFDGWMGITRIGETIPFEAVLVG